MNADALLRYMPITLIVLLGAALRFYGLGQESLWLDEALSWQQAELPLPALLDSVAADVHPPLHALLLHAFITAFGDGEASLRLLSAICSTLCIPLTWAICRPLAGTRAAGFAALLVAISPFAIEYAQEARMYALLCCTALASMLSFVWLTYRPLSQGDSQPPRTVQLAYIVTTTLLMYSHVYGLFIVLAQNVVMAVRYLPRWPQRPALPLQRWAFLQAVLGCLLLPWVVTLAGQVARVQTSFWIDPPTLADLTDTFREYMGVMPALQLAGIAALCGVIALLYPTPKLQLPAQTDNTDAAGARLLRLDSATLLLVWLIVPIGVPFVLSLLVQPIYMPRYTIASSPVWFMLVAIGLSAMTSRWVRNGLLGLLLLATAGVLPVYYSSTLKTPWPAVVALVEDNANPGDLVLFHNPDVLAPWQYYRQRRDLDLQTVVAADTWQAAGVTDTRKPDVRGLARGYTQVWLVSGYDRKTAITELEIVRQLADVLTPLGGREFDAIRVFRFAGPADRDVTPPPGSATL